MAMLRAETTTPSPHEQLPVGIASALPPSPSGAGGGAAHTRFGAARPASDAITRGAALASTAAWDEPPSIAEPPPPLRCRLGLHRWLPLALSLGGARAGLSVSFCRCCAAVRRPARLG